MQPVILLAFSNDQDAYLDKIVLEQKSIKNHLWQYDNNSSKILVRDIAHASIEDIFNQVNYYHNRIQFFHYGGHASGQGLQLESDVGFSQHANSRGLAGLLGSQKALKLVFLNGCATEGQVQTLLDSGVKAVIATSVAINDSKAYDFSEQFYEALVAGCTILESFIRAKSFLETHYDDVSIKEIKKTKGLRLKRESRDSLPWGIYLKPENEAVLDEKLPQRSYHEVMVDDNFSSANIPKLNQALVKKVFIAIKENPNAQELIHEAKAARRKIRPQDLRDAIIRSYLSPISVHLRTLFSIDYSKGYTQERLQQISIIHLRTIELIAFILISDLWDEKGRHEPIDYTEAEEVQLKAFFALNEKNHSFFDYILLIDAIISIFNRNNWKFFIEGFNQYRNGMSKHHEVQEAHDFLILIKNILEEDVPARLIEMYCIKAEKQLAALLAHFHYLTDYNLIVVKNIEVIQLRKTPLPSFRHIIVELDNNYNDQGTKDNDTQLEDFTDMESVLLYKNRITENLNLSPFVIDENALTKNLNSKVYFFKYLEYENKLDPEDDDLDNLIFGDVPKGNLPTLYYQFIENETDQLSISKEKHKTVARIFQNAKNDILNITLDELIEDLMEDKNDDDLLNLID